MAGFLGSNRNLFWMVGLLLVQQLIVASSTIWLKNLTITLASLGQNSVESGPWKLWLACYLASLLLPYFPGVSASLFGVLWRESLHLKAIQNFTATYQGQIDSWANTDQKQTKTALLAQELPPALKEMSDTAFAFLGTTLNVILNIAVLSVFIESTYVISFGVSVFLLLGLLKRQNRKQALLEKEALHARGHLTAHALRSWDNVLIGNSLNSDLWNNQSKSLLTNLKNRNMKWEMSRQGFSLGVAWVTFVPSLGVATAALLSGRLSGAESLAIVATLPRLFMILNNIYEFFSVGPLLAALKSRFTVLDEELGIFGDPSERTLNYSENTRADFSKRIQFDKIRVDTGDSSQPFRSFVSSDKFIEYLNALPAQGLLTVRGPNGSGKSTTLLFIKSMHGARAFYLPPKNDLCFESSECSGASTGQVMIQQLESALDQLESTPESPGLLLIDEWDANLDDSHLSRLAARIQKIAQKRLVIQVRHRN